MVHSMVEIFPRSLKMPQNIISKLQQPMGTFFQSDPLLESPEKRVIKFLKNKDVYVFVVGDFVSNSLFAEKFIPDLIIIDEKTQRNKSVEVDLPEKHEILEVTNKPGEISKSAWELIRILCATVFENPKQNQSDDKVLKVIKVTGEEDLLVLPLIVDAPPNSVVLYGQPPMLTGTSGIVLIEITKEVKNRAISLLDQFETI